MLKSYSPLTLLWSLPLAFLIGIVEGVARIPFGRFPLPGVVAAWLWNVVHLPSAIRQRFSVRRGREAGDEELFRYQVSGSARLRLLWDDILLRVRDRFPEGVLSGFADAVEAGQQRVRHPAFFVAAIVALFAFVATREVWTEHLPIGGFALPPHDSATETLRAFAGGWNPAGLGSPEALRPDVGAVALMQLVTFGSGGVAIAIIVLGSFLAGSYGVGLLVRIWGIDSIAGYLAGTTLMAGPAMIAATGSSRWAVIPAFAALPYAVRAILRRRMPSSRLGRLGRNAAAVLFVGVVGVFTPAGIVVPIVAGILWAIVGPRGGWPAVVRAVLVTAFALPLLMPWILYLRPLEHLRAGDPAYWEPGWLAVGAIGLAALGGIASHDRAISTVAGWGAGLVALGALVARSGGFGFGDETLIAGLLLSGLGVAAVTAAALEGVARRRAAGSRSWAVAGGALGSIALIMATMALAGPGRAGLPEDDFTGLFDFAVGEEALPTRVLLFGVDDDLPGASRSLDGLGYRVFVPPYPSSWEAHLGEERLGDRALHSLLDDLVQGRTRRGGAALADFGIGWIAFTEPSPLENVFEAQLDLVALRSLDFPVFRNESVASLAVSVDGDVWVPDGTGFTAPPGGSSGPVIVAANADFRWGPGDWSQADWANQVVTQGDEIEFAGHGQRRIAAIGALAWLLILLGVVAAARVRDGAAS
jgi:hypothetical protein